MKKLFLYPSSNLVIAIPITMVLGFIAGMIFDLSFMKNYILILTFLMIYPTMIGFKIKEAVDLSYMKPLIISLLLNFIFIPAFAYFLGYIFLQDRPQIFVGLIMIALFPTSGMTISWTMLSKGNVAAAIKITAISLLLGSLLAPWYLYFMVGKLVEVDIIQTFITILLVVILPMIAGSITFGLIKKKMTQEQYNKQLKPLFPAASVWFLLILIFVSIGMKAKTIVSSPSILINILIILLFFYVFNFFVSTMIARRTLQKAEGYALLYGTVMRNLSIALGIAVSAFGPETALVVTLAFILQVQGAAWYGKFAAKYNWISGNGVTADLD